MTFNGDSSIKHRSNNYRVLPFNSDFTDPVYIHSRDEGQCIYWLYLNEGLWSTEGYAWHATCYTSVISYLAFCSICFHNANFIHLILDKWYSNILWSWWDRPIISVVRWSMGFIINRLMISIIWMGSLYHNGSKRHLLISGRLTTLVRAR